MPKCCLFSNAQNSTNFSACIALCVVNELLAGSLLENELRRLQKVSEVRETELQSQVNALKAETERQNKLIGQVGEFNWLFSSLSFSSVTSVCRSLSSY